ncbi:hypothetical protein [Embleya hyalina]|uniref:DUF1877 domain-containing protein n=1 Tax=Embleya hyalina TaxID=516124 RepID=A0A401YQS7_9ACTN|nr:hypothetical protein [Embleya hyalina]GCD96974.1 hypothetical protein EHYA_04661 [Embleya hyalina]
MAFDVVCLIADWIPTVAACRQSRGTAFYWDAPENPDGDDLRFASERHHRGFDFLEAGSYYETLRRRLPNRPRVAADAFMGSVYHDLGPDRPAPPDDLAEDADVELSQYEAYYSMRPARVRAVLERARSVPWSEIEPVAADMAMASRVTRHDVRDFEHFRRVVGLHQTWLTEAARTDRGLIVLLSG